MRARNTSGRFKKIDCIIQNAEIGRSRKAGYRKRPPIVSQSAMACSVQRSSESVLRAGRPITTVTRTSHARRPKQAPQFSFGTFDRRVRRPEASSAIEKVFMMKTISQEPARTGGSKKRWARIIPLTLVMYTIAFIDRTNISMGLPSISRDLHLNRVGR